jgi:Tfp pilus assembly protein PilX
METVVVAFETFEITNSCICEDYDEDTEMSSPSNECWGCYDDEVSNLWYEVIKPWMNANGYDEATNLIIRGSGMTWQRLSGYAYATPKTIVEKLSINGDWTLRFKITDGAKTLTAVRYSHDEPVGTGEFTFEVAEEEDEDELF